MNFDALFLFIQHKPMRIFISLYRSSKKNNNQGNQSTNPYETGFDISFVTTPATESQRPDSTYDLIRFDDVEDPTPSNKENHDNTQNDYMSLLRRQKDYEQLSFMKTTEPSQEFRPSAIPNEYHIMADTAAAGSAQPADDYMEPIHTIQP
ncbi:uncharacterized protein LOC128546015 [Mercenaria mercenaria]|uniref:uncharacterized protein LOC128546015 n=1 Tax=Mercenaria mercenaria TaxID=6596 RepID=UPI00234E86D2|nr:uncharacterized protein LOC128546015 [Mercenaria mercenaria]